MMRPTLPCFFASMWLVAILGAEVNAIEEIKIASTARFRLSRRAQRVFSR
jgi:hypothetical protein